MLNQKRLTAIIAVFSIVTAVWAISPTVYAEDLVPSWIKNNAGWWAEGTVDDTTFLNGIKFLVENDIIKISDSKDRKSTRLNSSHVRTSRMPSSA